MANDKFVTHSNFFTIEIDGIQTAKFYKCEGLESETYVYEVEEGGVNRHTHKFVGRTRFPNIILEHGITNNTELYDWYKDAVLSEKELERKNGSIVLYDIDNSTELKRWNFIGGFPCRWVGPKLGKTIEEVAFERIEIAYNELEVDHTK